MSAQPTARDDEQQPLEAVESPGKRLRIARQARGMSQGDIASHLHLSQTIIQALENDDHERLPGPVFARGYLRNYARLMGLDDDSLLAGHNHTPTHSRRPAPVHQGVKPEIRSSHFAVRLVSWILVLGLIGLLAVWWQGHLEWSNGILDRALEAELFSSDPKEQDNGGLTLPQPEPDQAPDQLPRISEPAAGSSSVEPPADMPSEEPGTVPEEPVAAAETPSEAAEPQPPATTATPVEEQPQSTEEESQAATAETAAEAPILEPASGDTGASGKIVFEFLGPCWVDVRDSTRKFKLFGEMSKGKREALGGTPPYSVIIGNSAMVKITVDGEPFDIEPLSRGSVARFTLDPSTSSSSTSN